MAARVETEPRRGAREWEGILEKEAARFFAWAMKISCFSQGGVSISIHLLFVRMSKYTQIHTHRDMDWWTQNQLLGFVVRSNGR